MEGRILAHREYNDKLFDFFDAVELLPGLMLTNGDMSEDFGQMLEGYCDQYNCNYIVEEFLATERRPVLEVTDLPVVWALYNDERSEFEAISKGYRGDVYAQIGADFFHLEVYDLVRLRQDFESEISITKVYTTEPNQVLVSEVNAACIKLTVKHLWQQRFFEIFKPERAEIPENLDLLLL